MDTDKHKHNDVSRHVYGFTLVKLLVVIAIIGITVEVKPNNNEPLTFELTDD